MSNPNLEQKVKELEQKVATLKGQVQEQATQTINVEKLVDQLNFYLKKHD